MKKIEDIKIIDKREAEILYEALHEYFMKMLKEKGQSKKTIEVNQLYQELKTFVNSEANL